MLRLVPLVLVLLASAARAELRFVDWVHGADGLDAIDAVVVSPDERHVYTAAFLDHAIVTFTRDPASGLLARASEVRDSVGGVDGLDGVHGLVISPDGAHVYAAGFYEDEIAMFARDAVTGALSFVGVIGADAGGDHLHGVFSLALSPDGAWLYAAATYGHAITVFAREPASGALTFAGSVVEGEDGVTGLTGPFQITVSPDGAQLYSVGGSLIEPVDNAVVVFARDAATGGLTFVEATFPATLDRAHSVEVSPDGRTVYVGSFYTNRVLVFARDAASGALVLVQEVIDGIDGVVGLIGPHATATTPDGTRVHVAGFWSGVVASFARDTTTGILTPLGYRQNGRCGVRGLAGVRSLALAADGTQLYAAGEFDDALALFSEVAGSGCRAAGDLCRKLGAGRDFAVVATQRLHSRPVLRPAPTTTRLHHGGCALTASLAATVVDGPLVATASERVAAAFRRAGRSGTEAEAVVTGGGAISGAAWLASRVRDTSGAHPSVQHCKHAIGDVVGFGVAAPELALGRIVVRAGETRTLDLRGAAAVRLDALVLDDAAGVGRDGDCHGAPSARLEIRSDPGAQVLLEVSGTATLGRCHAVTSATGALVALHAVGRGEPVVVEDAALPAPNLLVVAPGRVIDASAHAPGSSTALGNLVGRKVLLRGSVELTATCAD